MTILARVAIVCATLGPLQASVLFELTPSPQIVVGGTSVSVNAVVTGLGNPPSVGSFDIDIGFNSALLSPTSVTFGTLLGDPALFEALTDFKFSPGVVNIAEVSLLSNAQLDARQSPNIILATLHFQALTSGTATFNYLGGPIDDGNGILLFGGKVPEPATVFLTALSLMACAWVSRRRIWR
jgi:hypothetical protein